MASESCEINFFNTSCIKQPLLLACKQGDKTVVEGLLEKGIDLEVRDKRGRTGLHLAVIKNYLEIVHLLISYQAPIESRDRAEMTPLLYAIAYRRFETIEFLLSKGANIEKCIPQGQDIYWILSQLNLIDSIRLLLVKKLLKDNSIIFSDEANQQELLIILKEQLLKITCPLFEAVQNECDYHNFLETLEYHLDYQRLIRLMTFLSPNYLVNRLSQAIEEGNIPLFKNILACGINISTKLTDKSTFIHIAALSGHNSIIDLLRTFGATLKDKNEDGWTALHFAIDNNKIDTALHLISLEHTLVDEANSLKQTPLHFAVIQGSDRLIEILLEQSSDINNQDKEGLTPLHYAWACNPQVKQILIERGAQQDIIANNRMTPSSYAQYNQSLWNRYRYNQSLLVATSIIENITNHHFYPVSRLFLNKLTMQLITVEEIVSKICSTLNWGETKRTFEYIAIGIRTNGSCIITTNHHSPVIFRLEDITSTWERFSALYNLRDNYNQLHQTRYNFARGKTRIHPETLLAALKQHLDIQDIILINAGNQQDASCIYCAHYLLNHDFFNHFHIRKIKNYLLPTQIDIDNAISWLKYLEREKKLPVTYQYLGTIRNKEPLDNSTDNLKPSRFNQSDINSCAQEYIPLEMQRNNTYYTAQKLAEGKQERLTKKCSSAPTFNLSIAIYNDGHFMMSPTQNGQIEPVNPESPRSVQLAHKINFWLNNGTNTKLIFSDLKIEAYREGITKDANLGCQTTTMEPIVINK